MLLQKALASQLWALVVHSFISEREIQKKKKKKKAPFLKAASERKDKLTYDHVVLFRLCLLMQDFATYNRYLKELLTKKNCHLFSLTYQTEGNAFWSHAVIAGCRQFGSKSY